jgi:threonine aldolase
LPGDRGRISAAEISKWINPAQDVHFPLTQLVSLEDTANRGGGAVYDTQELAKISALCKELSLPLHLDGARIFNALAVNKMSAVAYSAFYDSISVCLSKGLGAPVGSLLLGTAEFIEKARRVRKVFGGGMRQAGIIAAGGLFALKNNVARLKEDHLHALRLGEALQNCSKIESVLPVQTNIVVATLKDPAQRDFFIEALKNKGILCMAFGPGMIRMVTHLNFSEKDCSFCVETLVKM